jgi:hypothetical protein
MPPTPGPWHVERENRHLGSLAGGGVPLVTVMARSLRIARVDDIEDARLIASTPDLLAALHEVRELLAGYVDVSDSPDGGAPVPNNAMRAQQVIDAAISRAEG